VIIRIAKYILWFLLGATLVALPFFVQSYLMLSKETERGEPTMGPGIAMFSGLVIAPFGGLVSLLIAFWVQRKKDKAR
jgi:hypothetical protein